MHDDFFYCVLNDFDCMSKAVNQGINESFFLDSFESKLWYSMIKCFIENDTIDVMILTRWIKNHNLLQELPRIKILEICSSGSKLDINTFDIILNQIIEEKKKSDFLQLLLDSHKALTGETLSVFELLEIHKQSLSEIDENCTSVKIKPSSPNEEIEQVIKDIKENKFGYKFKLKELDNISGGIARKCLYTIGGRPGTGKTTLGMNILNNNPEIKTAFISFEMNSIQCIERFMQIQNRDNKKFREMKDTQLRERAETLNSSNIKIFDCNGKDERILRNILESDNYELIVIDYLQVIKASQRFKDERLRINFLMGYINQLRSDYDTSILLLSQLNRSVDTAGGALKMSHLKESGKIEEDSDLVMLLYHRTDIQGSDNTKAIEPKVLKNRYGSLSEDGQGIMTFCTSSMRFYHST